MFMQCQKNKKDIILENRIYNNKIYNVEISFFPSRYNTILLIYKDISELEKRNKIIISQKRLSDIGVLASGVAHNLKSPLSAISGANEIILSQISKLDNLIIKDSNLDDTYKDSIITIIEKCKKHCANTRICAKNMEDAICSIKSSASSESAVTSFSIQTLIINIKAILEHELMKNNVHLNVEINALEYKPLKTSISVISQILCNLIINAIHSYNNEPGTIDLIIRNENKKIYFVVKDYGCGIDDDIKKKVFSRMITTKGDKGTGIGLYTSKIKAMELYGDLEFSSSVGRGSEFTLWIPESL